MKQFKPDDNPISVLNQVHIQRHGSVEWTFTEEILPNFKKRYTVETTVNGDTFRASSKYSTRYSL